MKIRGPVSLLAVLTAGAGCPPKGEHAPPGQSEWPSARAISMLSTVTRPSPVALRICDLVQREPLRRKSECCGAPAGEGLFDECVRVLEVSLLAQRSSVDLHAVDRCSEAMEREHSGCHWVTPSQALPPRACEGLTLGRVVSGGACRSSLECLAPLHCEGATPTEAGHCAAPKPIGAPCARSGDALASYLLQRDLDESHPTCLGSCSVISGKCEASTALVSPPRVSPPRVSSRQRRARAGEACHGDFDCAEGGCGEDGRCGMKCAISLEAGGFAASTPALSLPRRSRSLRVSEE